ncbi:MAG: MoaD/ThiS family protein [Candidatus Eisenbacteria bacterium]|nr:MoaD/ThiS family protein [Candidatus Eisenbacteria bacterium]
MKVAIRMTGWMRELAGTGRLELELAGDARIEEALRAVAAALPPGARARLGRNGSLHPSVLAVVRDRLAPPGSTLAPGDEIELLLPVAGG